IPSAPDSPLLSTMAAVTSCWYPRRSVTAMYARLSDISRYTQKTFPESLRAASVAFCPASFLLPARRFCGPDCECRFHKPLATVREGGRSALECGSLLPLSRRPACWPVRGAWAGEAASKLARSKRQQAAALQSACRANRCTVALCALCP